MVADAMVEFRRRFTVDEYEHMGQTGIIRADERTELLDGAIVRMAPIGPRHAAVVDILDELLHEQVGRRATVRVQNPIRLVPESEPQPDLLVVRRRADFYASAHPSAKDALLAIEVADSTIAIDRGIKVRIYAEQGVPEVWVVDLKSNSVHIYVKPLVNSYQDRHTARSGEFLEPTTVTGVRIAVSDVLGC